MKKKKNVRGRVSEREAAKGGLLSLGKRPQPRDGFQAGRLAKHGDAFCVCVCVFSLFFVLRALWWLLQNGQQMEAPGKEGACQSGIKRGKCDRETEKPRKKIENATKVECSCRRSRGRNKVVK
jgi:hypothetical protein